MNTKIIQPEIGIIFNYMPPFPNANTKPKAVVVYKNTKHCGDRIVMLRYSCGPKQGHFWDVYGDDYLTEELAIEAINWLMRTPKI